VIVRIGFVILTLFSGAGIWLYLLGWIVIAKEGRAESSAIRALRGSPEGNRSLLFVVLAIGAVLVLSSPLIWWDGFGFGDGLALPLLLIAAGIAFLIWPAERTRPDRSEDLRAAGDDLKAAGDEIRSEFAEARDSFNARRQEWQHGYRQGPARRRHQPRPPRPPKPAPFLGPLTMAVLLVFAGVSIVGQQADWWDVDPAVYGGGALSIIGVALVVSAFFGRARGLIFVGVLVLPVAWFLAAVDLDWHEGVGERLEEVSSIDELEDDYAFGFGDFEIVLSEVDFDGTDRTVAVGLTMGELPVWVPDTVTVDLQASARAGEVEVFEADGMRITDDGFPADVEHRLGGSGDGVLTLDVEVGFGAIDVRACTTQPDGVRCP